MLIHTNQKEMDNIFDSWIGKQVKFTKIKDLKFEDKHPNGINIGYETEGKLAKLEIEQPLVIHKTGKWNYLITSPVKTIVHGKNLDKVLLITTENSEYKLEAL